MPLKYGNWWNNPPQFPTGGSRFSGMDPTRSITITLPAGWDLKQVDFEGKQNPVPYYRQASVCMLTSAYEGFAMILTEAQQTGAVPHRFRHFCNPIRHHRR